MCRVGGPRDDRKVSFGVVSDTYMTAVVPSGATTGPVVVTTPGGAQDCAGSIASRAFAKSAKVWGILSIYNAGKHHQGLGARLGARQ